MKRTTAFGLSLVLLFSANRVLACTSVGDGEAAAESLTVVAPTFSVTEEDGHRAVTTLGSLQNTSSGCLDGIVVEARYFDSKGVLVDTITQPLYRIVVPPKKEVAFRIHDAAAQPKEAYVSQAVRVVDADARNGTRGRSKSASSTIVELLVGWGPMIPLIALWIFFMQRMRRKDSPQNKTIAYIEQQNSILEAQSRLLERIASAAEGRMSGSSAIPSIER